mmetsp:Transcript_55312/g.115705  ORF Transcript_55312/g.115705 Transcript_55312/m.115705 type:complete len:461 (+) Transcript_55312:998-2380(+)
MHLVPVVGREAPVLLRVARRARVPVQLEEVRLGPDVAAAPRHPDGEIPLEGDAVGLGVLGGLQQLQVQVVLHKVRSHHRPVVRPARRHHRRRLRRPLAPRGRVEPLVVAVLLLAQLHLEGGVGLDPGLGVLQPGLELRVLEHLGLADGVEYGVDDLALLVQHLGVVDLPVAVELLHERLRPARRARHVRPELALVVVADGAGADVAGVEGEGRRRRVRRRVLSGVVDGQDLDELQARLGAPVHHLLEVEELADARRVARLDPRDGDGHAEGLERPGGVVEGLVAHHELGRRVRAVERRLARVLLLGRLRAGRVEHRVLVLEREVLARHRHLAGVEAAAEGRHGHHLAGLPRAEGGGLAGDPDAVAGLLARGEDDEAEDDIVGARGASGPGELVAGDGRVLGRDVGRLQAAAEDGAGEARGGEDRGAGGAEGVLDVDFGPVAQSEEAHGSLRDTRLVAMRL